MRWAIVVGLVAVLAGCGGSGGGGGGGSDVRATITGQVLGDSLAVAAKNRYEELGQFATQVGDQGGSCVGAGARWTCRLDILQDQTVRDVRTYALAVDGKGCWVARQTGTDIGGSGTPRRPDHPDRLRGCVR